MEATMGKYLNSVEVVNATEDDNVLRDSAFPDGIPFAAGEKKIISLWLWVRTRKANPWLQEYTEDVSEARTARKKK